MSGRRVKALTAAFMERHREAAIVEFTKTHGYPPNDEYLRKTVPAPSRGELRRLKRRLIRARTVTSPKVLERIHAEAYTRARRSLDRATAEWRHQKRLRKGD
jgi:hypothetical protein